MQLNDKLRTLRQLNDFSQEDMAAKLGMSTNGYAKIERGLRRLDIPKLEEIAAVFGMELLDFLNFDADKTISLIHDSKQSIIYHQINKDSQQHTYFGSNELEHEIEKLNLMLAHKDEIIAQKQREIELLQTLVQNLQANKT